MVTQEIDFNKLTIEAEAGHGHFVRRVLDEMSFPDRIRTLRKIQKLSEERHHKNPGSPYLTYKHNSSSDYAYANIDITLNIPHQGAFGMDKADTLYDDYIDLRTGDETLIEADLHP